MFSVMYEKNFKYYLQEHHASYISIRKMPCFLSAVKKCGPNTTLRLFDSRTMPILIPTEWILKTFLSFLPFFCLSVCTHLKFRDFHEL
jgi:hypothetical protein